MADDPNEHWFSLTLPDGATWRVVRAHYAESFSELFECVVEAASSGSEDPLSYLRGKAVFAFGTAKEDDPRVRYIGGIVAGVVDRGWIAQRRVAEFRIVPRLWLLDQSTNYRVFQNLDALAIVEMVLDEHKIYMGKERVKETPDPLPKREYCTQYGESDLAFVRRLLEEEGIGFLFKQDWAAGAGDPLAPQIAQHPDTLVLGQWSKTDAFPLTITTPIDVVGEGGATSGAETIRTLEHVAAVVSTGHRLRDYDFTRAAQVIDEKRDQADALGSRVRIEYPGRVTLGALSGNTYGESDAKRLAPLRLQETETGSGYTSGRGDVVAFGPGAVFQVMREGGAAAEKFLATRVTHRCEAPEVLYLDSGSGSGASRRDRYVNTFECIPPTQGYRPARVTPKPRALTPQSAVVVPEPKTSTDPICTDAYGRVKVRFQWARPDERPADEKPKNDSCWIRTTQAWAGDRWGFVFLPRVGMEVLVQFLDADPDRPVVTGCLYNSVNMPPEVLPGAKTKSILRTQNTPTGAGYNELSFEDEVNKELVYLRAQKDLTEKVFNDHTADYDHDETVTVGNDQTFTVKHDRKATVQNDDSLDVTMNRRATVGGNDSLEVEKNLSVTVFAESTLTVSKTHVMSIDEGLTVKVGGNSGSKLEMLPASIKLTIGSSKIEMTASTILVQTGSSKLDLAAAAASLESTKVEVKATATAAVQAGATLDLKASGVTTVAGALVKIN
ncbi:MAG: type VI secretion system tip protein TssI/VgrG [Polyangiales bacterium]